MPYIAIILIGAALLLCACSPKAPEAAPVDTEAISAEIEANMAEIIAAAEKLSTEALQKYLSDEPGAVFYLRGSSFNKTELISAMKQNYETVASQKLTMIKKQVNMPGPDAVAWLATSNSDIVSKKGEISKMELTETWLWKKVAGEWKVGHYHESWK